MIITRPNLVAVLCRNYSEAKSFMINFPKEKLVKMNIMDSTVTSMEGIIYLCIYDNHIDQLMGVTLRNYMMYGTFAELPNSLEISDYAFSKVRFNFMEEELDD